MGPKEYRGRLSTGCEPCRARRVKCDERKPICSKCVKLRLGDQCKYRDLVEISFRNESYNAAERARKTWRARAKNSSSTSTDSESDASTLEASPHLSVVLASLPKNLFSVDVNECAVNRFFYDFILPDNGLHHNRAGIFDYVPDLFAQAPPNSSLREAIYAVSLANYSRRATSTLPNERANIQRHYGNALARVKKEMQIPALAASDQVVLAVQMLGIYEQMSSGGNNPLFLQAHAHGLAALLKLRELPSLGSGYQWRLFQSINAQMLTACMMRNIPSFISYSDVKEHYETSPYPFHQLTGFVHRAVDLLALWRESCKSCAATDPAEELAFLSQFTSLSMSIQAWEISVPDHGRFSTCATPEPSTQPKWLRRLLEHPGMPQVSHRYAVYQNIYIWNQGRAVWILITQVLLTVDLRTPGADPTEHMMHIWRLIEDICSSIWAAFVAPIDTKPYADTVDDVCGFRALMVLLPIKVAQRALGMLPQTAEMKMRAAWIDEVVVFLTTEIHKSRPR